MSNKFYDYLLTLLKPFIWFFGHIGLPKRKFTGEEYFKFRDKINVGCILLTKTNYEVSNLFNPCPIKHGAIYVGNILDTEVKYVLEAVGEGVKLTDLVTFLLTKDVVICVEYKLTMKSSLNNLRNFVILKKGSPYDYLFNIDSKSTYCYELCAEFIKNFYPRAEIKMKEIIKDKFIFDHNTFLDKDLFTVVFSFNGEK